MSSIVEMSKAFWFHVLYMWLKKKIASSFKKSKESFIINSWPLNNAGIGEGCQTAHRWKSVYNFEWPQCLWIQPVMDCEGATVCSENNPFINGPMQFKPVLFKDQLIIIIYSLFSDRLREVKWSSSLIVCHPFIVFWMSLAIMGEKKYHLTEKRITCHLFIKNHFSWVPIWEFYEVSK